MCNPVKYYGTIAVPGVIVSQGGYIPPHPKVEIRHPHVLHIMIIFVKYICPSDCVRRRRTGGFCVSDGGDGIQNQLTNSLRLLDDRKEDKGQSRERRRC